MWYLVTFPILVSCTVIQSNVNQCVQHHCTNRLLEKIVNLKLANDGIEKSFMELVNENSKTTSKLAETEMNQNEIGAKLAETIMNFSLEMEEHKVYTDTVIDKLKKQSQVFNDTVKDLLMQQSNQIKVENDLLKGELQILSQIILDLQEDSKRLETLTRNLENGIEQLNADYKTVKAAMRELNVENRFLNNTVADLRVKNKHLEGWIEELNETLQDQDILLKEKGAELERLQARDLLGPMSSAFVATSTDPAFFTHNMTVVFDKVFTDAGNNYDKSTGKFKATIPGRYLFSVSVRGQKQNFCHPGIYKNGILVMNAFSGDDPVNWSSTGSVTVVLDLEVDDDEVFIREAHSVFSGAYEQRSFTGVLLYPF